MIRYSVLVPQRNAGDAIARQIPELRRVLEPLALPFEILCIDEASTHDTLQVLAQLMERYNFLRVLRLDRPVGLSAALTAGIAAARGEIIIAIGPDTHYPVEKIPHLIAALSRGDLALGRRRGSPLAKAWQRVAGIPRWFLLGHDIHNPNSLFWAARREAVAGLELGRGMIRYLPSLVTMRGFRISEVTLDGKYPSKNAHDSWPNPGDLLATWWLRRRHQNAKVEELGAHAEREGKTAPQSRSRWIENVVGPPHDHSPARRRDSA